MRLTTDVVGLDAVAYQQHIRDICADRDIWRSLIALDISGFRNACYARAPHLPQPEDDQEALHIMHLARVRMLHISPQQRRYSEYWLRERLPVAKVVSAVGIAIKARNEDSIERAATVTMAMAEAVEDCTKAGIDIDTEAAEVRRRMGAARQKVL